MPKYKLVERPKTGRMYLDTVNGILRVFTIDSNVSYVAISVCDQSNEIAWSAYGSIEELHDQHKPVRIKSIVLEEV